MTLQQLQSDAKTLAQGLYNACLEKHTGHPLLKRGIFNAGVWRSSFGKAKQKNISVEEATFFGSLLPVNLPAQTNQHQPWPWQQRNRSNSKKKTKDWIQVLLDLDDQATIFVDVIPSLGVWICDIFNYIPRDIWSLATRLIARFYRSSKQLFATIYGTTELSVEELAEIRSQFFFAKIDNSLEELFDFNKKINRGNTIRQVFCHLDEDQANERYGKHAHVHRHSLYLLFQVALLDPDWQGKLFDASKNTFQKHILKIKDDSCLSVLYTSLLDVCYFDGHQSSLNWSTILNLEMEEPLPTPSFPTSTTTKPLTNWQSVSEDVLRKKVLKIRALKSNIQLVMRFHITNLTHINAKSDSRTTQLYHDVQDWMESHQAKAEWREFSYDYLANWLQFFNDPSKNSLLHSHVKTIEAMSPLQQRKKLIEHYKLFVGKDDYALAAEAEQKLAFFELWHLLSMPNMFEESFGTHLIETRIPLIFEHVEGLTQPMLEFVKAQFPIKDIGKTEYSKLVILLAILVQEQKLNSHKNGLSQLIRDGIFEQLFVLETKTDDSIFSTDEITNYSASPIAVWFMNTSDFRAYRTPLLFQIIQSFLMSCSSEAQKFHLFWRLSIYEPDDEIYRLLAKNLQFPFHLLKENPVRYTNIDWISQCDLLQKLSSKQDKIDHPLNPSKERQSIPPIEILKEYGDVWKPFINNNHSVFLLKNEPAWSDVSWNEMVSFWKDWTETESVDTYLQFKEWKPRIESFCKHFKTFLSTIFHDASYKPILKVLNQIDVICDDLEKGNESDAEIELVVLSQEDSHCLKRQVPFELNFMYETVVSKIQTVMKTVVNKQQIYLNWDKEVNSPNIKFDKIAFNFTDDGYWKHTQSVFESGRVEELVAKSWIDNLGYSTNWRTNQYSQGLAAYDAILQHYPHHKFRAYLSLIGQVIESPKVLGKQYYPVLEAILKHLSQDEYQSQTTDLIQHEEKQFETQIDVYNRSLRKQGLHKTANILSGTRSSVRFSKKLLKFILNHCQASFVSAVFSLTLLLDFGEKLWPLYEGHALTYISSGVLSIIIAFGHPFFSKHYNIGIPVVRSLLNLTPSFGASVLFSYLVTLIWVNAEATVTMGFAAFMLMFFFTTIVKAGAEGAFEINK